MLALTNMLRNVGVKAFLEDYFQRLPTSGTFLIEGLDGCNLKQCIFQAIQVSDADVMICRRNARYEGALPTSESEMRVLDHEGYTFVVRHAERLNAKLQELATNFERDFAAPVNIHLYSTPSGEFGFGWHYDAEEVFILQTEGEKVYELRKNTVNPHPVEETLPPDMHYDREIMPLWKCKLAAGDWLYIPSGYWHRATAVTSSTSIALGLKPVTGIDVWDYLRSTLGSNFSWRQRLPPTGAIQTDRTALIAEVSRCLDFLKIEATRLFADRKLPDKLIQHFHLHRAPEQDDAPAEIE